MFKFFLGSLWKFIKWLFSSREQPKVRNTYHETYFSSKIARQLGGKAEVGTRFRRRADVLLKDTVYEVEWSTKPAEALGQALMYGYLLKKSPGIIILIDEYRGIKPAHRELITELASAYNVKLKFYIANRQTGALEEEGTNV